MSPSDHSHNHKCERRTRVTLWRNLHCIAQNMHIGLFACLDRFPRELFGSAYIMLSFYSACGILSWAAALFILEGL